VPTPTSTTVKLPLPEQVVAGRYRLVKSLGQGGMGLVFLAEQLGVGNQVAVKFLDPEPTDDDSRVARFLREARVGLEVKHPGAAQVLDLGRDESMRLFLVFEYVEGRDLRELLRAEGRLPFEEAKSIALKVAEVLHFAHQRGIVHRDIKPENIRVRRDLAGIHVKVLDFGIARLIKDTGVRLTAEGSLAGTPRYMAPEQVRDAPIDSRTDGYALGLVLFEMLTGAAAFTGKNISQILLKQVEDPLPPMRWVDPQLDFAQVDAFLNRACAKAPEARFQSMTDFVGALQSLVVDTSWPGPRPPPRDASDSRAPTKDGRGDGLSDTVIRLQEVVEEEPAPVPVAEVPIEVRETVPLPRQSASPSVSKVQPVSGRQPSRGARSGQARSSAEVRPARSEVGETLRGAPLPARAAAPRRRWPVVVLLMVLVLGSAAGWWLWLSRS
jgi:serine/threonine-protein kinase